MSHRAEQTESAIRRAVSNVLAEGLADPRYKGIVTVTTVELDVADGRATVGVSVLPEEAGPTTVAAIQHAASHIRREVGQKIRTRRMPALSFHLDASLKREARVLSAINEAMADTAPPAGEPPAEPNAAARQDEPS